MTRVIALLGYVARNLGRLSLATAAGALLLFSACVRIAKGYDPSSALGTQIRLHESGRVDRITRGAGVWVDADSGRVMGAVLERPSGPPDRSETIPASSIVRLSEGVGRAPQIVTMTEGSALHGDRVRFFVAWLQGVSVFRQFCNFSDMRPYSSSLIPTRVTEGTATVIGYDIVSSPLDSAVMLATAESDRSIRVLRISFAPAESDLMRVDEILHRRTDLLRTDLLTDGTTIANVTISSVSGDSSDDDVRYILAWPERFAIKFLLLDVNGRVLHEDQIGAEASAIRSAYDTTSRRFLVVFSSRTGVAVVASVIIFPNGTSGGVTNVASGNVLTPVLEDRFTIVEGGKTFHVIRSMEGQGRPISAVSATSAAEPSFRVAFWEWMYVTETRQQVIAGRPGGRVPAQPPPVTWCFRKTHRLYTLGLDANGRPLGEKRPHGPDFGCGTRQLWGMALSRDVRADQLLISPTASLSDLQDLQVEFVP